MTQCWLSQGKAFTQCREMILDFGLDGPTVLALSERDLEVRARSRPSNSARLTNSNRIARSLLPRRWGCQSADERFCSRS